MNAAKDFTGMHAGVMHNNRCRVGKEALALHRGFMSPRNQ